MSPLSYCIHSTQYFLSQENLDWSLYNGLEDILAWISANKMKVAHYCTWLVYDFKKKESGNMVWIYHIGAGRLCMTLSCVAAKELQLRTGQKILLTVFSCLHAEWYSQCHWISWAKRRKWNPRTKWNQRTGELLLLTSCCFLSMYYCNSL